MSLHVRSQVGFWPLLLLTGPALLVHCSGTEADNPVTDVVVTACKTSREYDPQQVGDFLTGSGTMQTAGSASVDVQKSLMAPGATAALRQPLTATADIPMGLSCVEWRLSGTSLDVQVVNFSDGCGVEWQGKAVLEGDRVQLLLDNPRCAVASCGNCLYDTATVLELPSVLDLRLELSANASCSGDPTRKEWLLPLTTAPSGMLCEYARAPGLGSLTGPAFMHCSVSNACDAGLTCVRENEYVSHCLPACTTDADCPLAGGTQCQSGLCVPDASLR
jgi:hypothetical protein